MTKLKDLVSRLESVRFKTANDKINQTERNNLKKDFNDSLASDLADMGFTVALTNDGVVLTIESEKDTVYIAVDGVVKNLDYDLEFEISEYELKVAKQVERELIRQERAKQRANKSKE